MKKILLTLTLMIASTAAFAGGTDATDFCIDMEAHQIDQCIEDQAAARVQAKALYVKVISRLNLCMQDSYHQDYKHYDYVQQVKCFESQVMAVLLENKETK